MESSIVWLLALGPLALLAASALPDRAADARAATLAARAVLAAGLAFGTAMVGALAHVAWGTLATPTLGAPGLGFALYYDRLTAIVFALVALVGLVVVRFSRHYMAGDPRHGRFTKWLVLTLAAVLLLILSGNLVQLVLAWIATSLGLQRLLVFYRERPAAVLAARKKFVASRLGDLCLVGAALLAWQLFGSLDYPDLFSGARALQDAGTLPSAAHGLAGLLVAAALLKSAQFPMHGWLLEVMETPTPVSALLHAGIVNAGGYLLLRLADLVALSAPSMHALVVVGGLTALFGSVVMLTQTSVKVSLAYSTIAQMGFMMLQCGLGAFPAALLHLVSHSLYKAHAFLSSGSVIDLARVSSTRDPGGRPHPARLGLALAIVLSVALLVGTLAGASVVAQPGVFALGTIVLLGLTHLVVNAIDERTNGYVLGRVIALAFGVATLYYALQWGAAALLADVLPPAAPLRGPFDFALVVLVLVSFTAITILQTALPGRAGEPRWQALYVHVSHGFYVNTVANRLVVRHWPAPPPRPSSSPHPAQEAA